MYRLKQTAGRRFPKKMIVLIVAGVLALAGSVLAMLELTNRTHFFGKEQAASIGPQTKGEGPAPADAAHPDDLGQDQQPAPTTPTDPKRPTDGPSAPSKPLQAPSGNFVSNHAPNLSGSPSPNLIQSICVTTPGATCTISFTKGGVTKSLPAQKTDGEGAAYWDWKLQDHGLTAGEWSVKATATLGSQTKSANDPLTLKVMP